ncbi:hypothetical protein HYR54_06775 [Candidatus Acetothermia bacterium]|nr:hypothetical protein [Candidatus Acetothermia bacterium]
MYQAHLWEIVDPGGGRGHKAIYRIKGKAEFLRKQQHNKLYNEAKDKETKTAFQDNSVSLDKKLSWKSDREKRRKFFFEGWSILQPEAYGWAKCAQAFRLPLEELGLPKPVANTLSGVILSRLNGFSCDLCQELYSKLGAYLWKCKDRLWTMLAQGVRKLCTWIGWAISRLLQGLEPEEPQSKRQHLQEINERLRPARHRRHGHQCECLNCERERVMRKRTEADRAYDVVRGPSGERTFRSWSEWAKEKLAENTPRYDRGTIAV